MRPALRPAAGSTAPDDAVRKAAVGWYVRLCSGDANGADRMAWQQWHDAHPDHRRAWQRIQSIRATTQRVPAAIARPTLETAGMRRRQTLRSLAWLTSAGCLSYGAYRIGTGQTIPGAALLAEFRTGAGEQRGVELADGSRMTLNTRTSADVRFDIGRRLIRLHTGEVLIETATHRTHATSAARDTRPFVVQTAHGVVRALGTRFIVRDDDVFTRVTVMEDTVDIRVATRMDEPVLLRAGQQIAFGRDGTAPARTADPAAEEWLHGSLVVNDWRLGDVITELARYRAGRLACDPAVADIRVSGAFPIHDTDKALAVIMRAFPVRALSLTPYWVRVVAV